SVPIRTMWLDHERGVAEYGVGSGVTIDATPGREAAELREKSRILLTARPAFSLIETMRLEHGCIVRLERHLARIAASCTYFERPFPEAEIRNRLAELCKEASDALRRHETAHASQHQRTTGTRARVRLTLGAEGTIGVEVGRLDDDTWGSDTLLDDPARAVTLDTPLQVSIARRAVDSHHVFLYHKTTHRSAYEHARDGASGHFDVILGNEHDEATEFTRGNLVARIDDELVTPPRTAGLLAGCLRAELLERGVVRSEEHTSELQSRD